MENPKKKLKNSGKISMEREEETGPYSQNIIIF